MEFSDIDSLLNQISSKSVSELASELLKSGDLKNKQSLQMVAEKIFKSAVKSETLCLKYVELVKTLSELHDGGDLGGYKKEKDETFKDMFIKFAIENIKMFRHSLIRNTTTLFPFEQVTLS